MAGNGIVDALKQYGITIQKSGFKSLKDLDVTTKTFVPYDSFYLLIEPSGGEHPFYLLFLDLSATKFYNKRGEHGKIEIYKQSDENYVMLKPVSDVMQIGLSKQKNDFSQDFLRNLIDSLPEKHIIQVPQTHGEKEIKEHNQIYDKFLSKNYTKVWGTRDLKGFEEDKILLASGRYVPKKVTGVDTQKMLRILKSKLALQENVIEKIFNSMSIHDILVGRKPANSGIVLYGPGGTGKTTIMKVFMEVVFEKIGAHISLNDEKGILNTSGVKDTKFYGAYQDYFAPKFTEGIREARIRGVPSFIPIDEGEIFVENPKDPKGHGPDVINFFKAHVGNHKEFIVCLATNVLKKDLNPIAVRRGRIATVEIPLPDVYVAEKLIDIFMKEYCILLTRLLTKVEREDLAKFLVTHKKPGVNIADFCKNFYATSVETAKLYEEGKTTDEIEKILRALGVKEITPEDFMKRYKDEILNHDEKNEANIALDSKLDYEIEKAEVDNFFQNLLHNDRSGVMQKHEQQLMFSTILKDFYLSKKGNIHTNGEDADKKVYLYKHLIYMVKLLPNIFNNLEYSNKLVSIDSKDKLNVFFEELFGRVLGVQTQEEFMTKIQELINETSNSRNSRKNTSNKNLIEEFDKMKNRFVRIKNYILKKKQGWFAERRYGKLFRVLLDDLEFMRNNLEIFDRLKRISHTREEYNNFNLQILQLEDVVKKKIEDSDFNPVFGNMYDKVVNDLDNLIKFLEARLKKTSTNTSSNEENKGTEYNNFMKIYTDIDTQRIIRSEKVCKLLGIDINTGSHGAKLVWKDLMKQYIQHHDYVEFKNEKYSDDICIEFIKDLSGKITEANPGNKSLDEIIGSSHNFQKFHNYASQSK